MFPEKSVNESDPAKCSTHKILKILIVSTALEKDSVVIVVILLRFVLVWMFSSEKFLKSVLSYINLVTEIGNF